MSNSQTSSDTANDLAEARNNAHWASQLVAAASSLIPAEEDFSHMSMVWDRRAQALVGRRIDAAEGIHIGLRISDLTLLVLDDDQIEAAFGLEGKTLTEGLAFLQAEVEKRGANGELKRPAHELPAHPTGEGAPFSKNEAALGELSGWFAHAQNALLEVKGSEDGASLIRCWPHHFDIATLIPLEDEADSESAKSIGVGLSPGDGSYNQPYWYVTPWPYPTERKNLPDLGPAGHWHVEGFVGAILTASEGGQGPEKTRVFLEKARQGCRQILKA